MTTTLVELTHAVQVVTDEHDTYRAECSCAWAGEWQADELLAELDGTEHVEVAVGPADPLDRLMSGLLDLQEDLVSVVIWLADNWSSDLPAPKPCQTLYGREGTVRLSIQCSEPGQLDKAARRLGEALTRDATYDQDGRSYWHAVRSFGQVSLEAWGLVG